MSPVAFGYPDYSTEQALIYKISVMMKIKQSYVSHKLSVKNINLLAVCIMASLAVV